MNLTQSMQTIKLSLLSRYNLDKISIIRFKELLQFSQLKNGSVLQMESKMILYFNFVWLAVIEDLKNLRLREKLRLKKEQRTNNEKWTIYETNLMF